MDLALPKFADSEDHPVRPHRPWIVMTDPAASLAPVRSTGLLRSPSACLNLDACHTPANTDQVLSGEDLPAAAGTEDRRQVIRVCDVSPDVQIVDPSQVGRDWDTRRFGVRSIRRIFQVVGCSSLLVLGPCLGSPGW